MLSNMSQPTTLNNMFISAEDIQYAHDILIPDKPNFDENKINIIKADDSRYIQACPGSGKTTTLLAKLSILANRLPFPDGRGICVLTHTNVAIDEIKAKLGAKADLLFGYPNFFGTFQSFVHKFFTNKALQYYYGSSLSYVDDGIANKYLSRLYTTITHRGNKLYGLLYHQCISEKYIIPLNILNTLGDTDVLLKGKVISRRRSHYTLNFNKWDNTYLINTLTRQEIHRLYEYKNSVLEKKAIDRLCAMQIDFANSQLICKGGKRINLQSESAQIFLKIKEKLYSHGILTFNEAYQLAFRYIRDIQIDEKENSTHRFAYLFIDEVQDCNKQQEELLDLIFDKNQIPIQCFGDYCQAIFDSNSIGASNTSLTNISKIMNSNRFGAPIAKVLQTICMEDNHELQGCDCIPSLKPKILVYNDATNVIPGFAGILHSEFIPGTTKTIAELAKELRLRDSLHRINIKACGWRTTSDDLINKRCICSYFPGFARTSLSRSWQNGSSTLDSLVKNDKYTTKDYIKDIIGVLVKVLECAGITNNGRLHTKTSLINALNILSAECYERFRMEIARWILLLNNCENVDQLSHLHKLIYDYTTTELIPLLGGVVNEEVKACLCTNGEVSDNVRLPQERKNMYTLDEIDIEVATIHSVKGETHVATLYLETFYEGAHESERIREQFKGTPYSGTDQYTLDTLKTAYVGMSRPSHLLCVAIDKSHFENLNSPELTEIWDIIYIDE